ncbi:TetR/AcrR family transcriptional regulator [Solirubrobacter ginsenosidimutans]|uniref:TetR/AcrR family transcriptional regulator n=1 Tax=Solirubrobacter ginsenosidimutans TaxID=490573 RepID=A0A9X3MT69_9ACTN|nr:TetR/AcrR family transcriptional regulator [Solirubrobacter ginsenosidimutans]MDA0161197.1 TetR/AcrR family transcriptional regulator [Solirubrobacter ginsenosidimutans]
MALELFARDGFAATTLAAIAEGAEVSPRTVSTYFPSKEGIVFAAYEDAIARLVTRLAAREPGACVVATVGDWARVEASLQDPVSSATVRARVTDGPDFARLRQAAIARDPDLWALERGHVRPLTDAVATAFAEEFAIPADSLAVRLAAETTTVALLEANARAARGDSPFNALLDDVLAFVRGGVAALRK